MVCVEGFRFVGLWCFEVRIETAGFAAWGIWAVGGASMTVYSACSPGFKILGLGRLHATSFGLES